MMKKREICICLSLFTANSIKQQEYGEKKLEWNHLTAVIVKYHKEDCNRQEIKKHNDYFI